ncbi:MAG TPA: hypothetical protein VNF91_10765 [Candidatus Acidoferrum sp.]|nr:hypothetical protein [Candidatus Acidoferrum sp.]
MKVRCYDVNSPPYPNYGGRGIRVCDRWLGSFEAFLADVGEAPSPDLSIERRDNDRGYEPGNVYWATDSEQNANKRMTDKRLAANRRAARSKGIRKYGVCISEEARKAGISKGTVMTRLRHGWTLSQALATPPVKVGSRPVRLG